MYKLFKIIAGKMDTTKLILKNFTRTTSSHGIPQIGYSRTHCKRIFWLVIFFIGLGVFSTQAYSLIVKFLKHEKTVTMELRFEAAPFPAVTICNLNPFKNSLVQQVQNIRQTLNVFDHVKKSSRGHHASKSLEEEENLDQPIMSGDDKHKQPMIIKSSGDKHQQPMNSKRSRDKRQLNYDPVLAFCDCPNINFECSPYLKPKHSNGTRCYCFRNKEYQALYPCYNEKMWTTLDCEECSYTGRCAHPPGGKIESGKRTRKCLCPALATYCVLLPSVIETIGDPMLFTRTSTTTTTTTTPATTTTTTSTTTTSTTTTSSTSTSTTTTSTPTPSTTTERYTGPTTIDPKMIQNFGFQDMTDEVAIVTKAKENLLFAMASLDMNVRIGLSYEKRELINMCSFNGKECDIDNDFSLNVDPVYGNCYIFNSESQHINRTSSRAGPMYGLRILVYTNLTDYMPTTEAAGIRIQIHNQDEQSFPDTFGYSAPTGFVSSFGIKLKEVSRLEGPYGECLINGKTADYIFENKSYSTEGCYRSCFQHFLLKTCGCADPRFPLPRGRKYCAADDPLGRTCLETIVEEVGGFHGIKGCDCKQPCKQTGFSVTYSAAVWPAPRFEVGECLEDEPFRKNAAMIEIYYEQLNFEKLEESEAYGFVNLLADFGGQLGLWLGFSIITCVEIIMLLIELITVCCCPAKDRNIKAVANRMEKPVKKKRKSLILGSLLRTSIDTGMAGHSGVVRKNDIHNDKEAEYCNCH